MLLLAAACNVNHIQYIIPDLSNETKIDMFMPLVLIVCVTVLFFLLFYLHKKAIDCKWESVVFIYFSNTVSNYLCTCMIPRHFHLFLTSLTSFSDKYEEEGADKYVVNSKC